MLAGTPSIEVVASCGDLDEAMVAIDDLLPDVVLTDIRMPPHRRDEGILIAAHCRKRHPDMGVVLLSQYAEASYVRTLLAEGTQGRGYLLKERVADLHELVGAVGRGRRRRILHRPEGRRNPRQREVARR